MSNPFQGGDLPKPVENAIRHERRVERALNRATQPFPAPPPEPPPIGIAGFTARMAEQRQQEVEREGRIRRLAHERPELFIEPDPLRDFASWQRAGRRRRKGRTRLGL